VSAEVLKLPTDDNNVPSNDTFSPALTWIVSPIETVFGETTKDPLSPLKASSVND
jgi:hypothetical protein